MYFSTLSKSVGSHLNPKYIFYQPSENKCNGNCYEIYPENHTKQRVGDERILGTLDQFCAAFYHVYKWEYRENNEVSATQNYFCLDQKKCIIALKKNEYAQPRTVVAVAKFESQSGTILYEARYTNCDANQHAEDFFKNDIENTDGEFRKMVVENPEGTITIYLTYQPCNKSTETERTDPAKSCCDTLEKIVTEILRAHGRKIDLCVKATHTRNLSLEKNKDEKYDRLRVRGVEGIKELMKIEGVTVNGMTQKDWDYLYTLTDLLTLNDLLTLTKDNKDRELLDQKVKSTFRKIENTG